MTPCRCLPSPGSGSDWAARVLYVGDGKMGALENRAFLQAGGDYYLCRLSETHWPPAVLADYLAPVWTKEQAWILIHCAPPGGTSKLIAAAFERLEPVTAADHHQGRSPTAPSSHAPLAHAIAHFYVARFFSCPLYKALSRFPQTALKMSAPCVTHVRRGTFHEGKDPREGQQNATG
jgi:hypothetical protein